MTRSAATTGSGAESVVSMAGELLGAGNRRAGSAVLVVIVVAALLLPVLLLLGFRAVDGTGGGALLGLTLGVVVDLAVLTLLAVAVSHKLTSRRLARLNRSVQRLDQRTVGLESTLGEQGATLARQLSQPAPAGLTRQEVALAVRDGGDRIQATQNLFALVTPRGPVPPMWGYVAAPDVLLLLVHKFLTLRPTLTVECGSGTSTLFLALAAQQYGISSRLVSLDHEAAYAESTRALLADHGVGHLAEVRHAPLTTTPLTDHEGPWYDPAGYQDLHDIGLAFVDGPPGDVGPHARYPMVPLLRDRFADRCTIVLDDMRRADERAVGERWKPLLEDFDYRYLPLIRGAGVFTRGC